MIEKKPLDTKNTGGVVGQPEYAGASNLIPTTQPDMKNSDTNLNQSASGENLSAKFKFPRVKEDVPALGKDQYEARS